MQQSRFQQRVKKLLTPESGKRRVWGAVKVCSMSTVKRAILQFAKLPEEATLHFKRKYKTRGEDRRVVEWWQVISGDEDVLFILDKNWEHVEVQISWHVQPCLIASETNELPEAVNVTNANEPSLVDKPETIELHVAINVTSANKPPRFLKLYISDRNHLYANLRGL